MIEITAHENQTFPRKFVIQTWPKFGLASFFCYLTYILTSIFFFFIWFLWNIMEREHRAKEMVMNDKEGGEEA